MRTNNNRLRVFVLLILLASSICGFSQLPCFENYKIDKAALQKAKEFESKNRLNNSIQSTSFVIRVYFHILNCNDGTLPGATAAQLTTEFNTLVAAYNANNVCFINAGYNNIYNTKLDTSFNPNTDNHALFDPYRVPDCINIFYTYKINGTNSSCSNNCGIGGIALTIPGTICLVAKGNIGQGQTIAHEVGHCLGLFHTFEPAFGYEDINGSNSSTAGDQITDTPADPFAYNGQPCYSTSSCVYNGSCKDPNGASGFSPPYSNLMAYWWSSNCYPSLVLTSGQYTRVNSFLNTDGGLISCESSPYVTESNISITAGSFMTSAINTLNTSGSVSIGGNATAMLGGGSVLLEPGFDAAPSAGGSTLIRLSQCSGIPNFKVSEQLKPLTTDNTSSNKLMVYPNPASSVAIVAFTLPDDKSKLLLSVYDVNMRLIKRISLESMPKGKNIIRVDLSTFRTGIYAITIQGASLIMRSFLIIQK